MSATPEARRRALNALNPNTMKLHTAYPGLNGANEVSGGAPAYAAKACSHALSSAGEARTLNASVVFDVPASTIRWVTLWEDSSLLFVSPNGGSPREFYADSADNTITVPAHGYAASQTIAFYGATAPGGLDTGTTYYVSSPTTDTFQVSATAGGPAINITSPGDTGCVVSALTETVYGAQDTHTITAYPFGAGF